LAIAKKKTLLVGGWLCSLALLSTQAQAQWWTAAPADYEECAERVESSSASRPDRTTLLSDCDSKFAGRRKPGGGYTYFDFMQNRSFDIAGPNPTTTEQRAIDEQYTSYLDTLRRSFMADAAAEKQREQQQASLQTEPVVAPALVPPKEAKVASVPRAKPHSKVPDCTVEPLACGWSKLSSGLKNITGSLFGTPSSEKQKRI
jgi:hypothetical protein